MLNALPPEQLANWLTLYMATGICTALAAFGAALAVGGEIIRGREWRGIRGGRAAAIYVPHLWWRWQKRYLTATPVILAIVAYYAASLRW
jgi:hypothetical protein